MEEKIKKMEKEIKEFKNQIKNLTSIVEELKGPEPETIYINLGRNLDDKKIAEEQEAELKYDNVVRTKSFEDIKKENEIRREELMKYNNALRGTPYHPTVSEEMNLITDADI